MTTAPAKLQRPLTEKGPSQGWGLLMFRSNGGQPMIAFIVAEGRMIASVLTGSV